MRSITRPDGSYEVYVRRLLGREQSDDGTVHLSITDVDQTKGKPSVVKISLRDEPFLSGRGVADLWPIRECRYIEVRLDGEPIGRAVSYPLDEDRTDAEWVELAVGAAHGPA